MEQCPLMSSGLAYVILGLAYSFLHSFWTQDKGYSDRRATERRDPLGPVARLWKGDQDCPLLCSASSPLLPLLCSKPHLFRLFLIFTMLSVNAVPSP
jgi:hypothetical protein